MARTILIVDDIKSNRMILSNMLSVDYSILEAENGKEALHLIQREPQRISAILLDIIMPVMDGYTMLEEMHANPVLCQIPVIVITGDAGLETEKQALALGANDVVQKPFDSSVLKRRLKNLITLHETSAIINAYQKDRLTGLWNRESFFERAEQEIKRKAAGYFVLACLDITNFKVINDQYGVEKGDQVLKTLAHLLRELCSIDGGICGRISADNFIALRTRDFALSSLVMPDQLTAGIQEKTGISVTLNIGRYYVQDVSLSVSAMYDRAKIAQKTIKGRSDIHIAEYNEAMREQILREQEIVNDMHSALEARQFEVWFQPQYNHATGAMVGSEALVRWRHPKRGLIQPGDFIPVFEENGFVYDLDRFVWCEVCRYLRKWLDEGRDPLPVSVNISRGDIFHADFISCISGLVTQYALPVDLLRLEITESAFSNDAERIISAVKTFIGLGFTVEIDDFGSGYSSLNTLKDVPAQILKLDMKFLQTRGDSERGGNIVESVVRMAKWLGMSVIAEGVELKQQADFLCSIGCNYIQGYLYARPMPAADYEAHCNSIKKEEHLLALETVEHLDNNAFWAPESIDTLIFNSYVGAACIFEYHAGYFEIIRATAQFAAMFGETTTVEDVIRLNWTKYLSPESLQNLMRALSESSEKKRTVTSEFIFLDLPGGPHKTYLLSTLRVIATAGSLNLVYCTNENITAQREAEEHSRESAQQMRTLMNDTPGGFVRLRLLPSWKLQTAFVNEPFCLMRRMQPEEVYAADGDDALCSVHPDDRQLVTASVRELAANGGTVTVQYRLLRNDDTYIPVNVRGRISKDESGDIFVNAYYTDLSEQEKAVYDQREMVTNILSTIMASSSDYAFAKDKDFRYLCCSPAFLKLAGLNDAREAIGKDDYDLFPKEMADQFRKNDIKLMSSSEQMVDFDEMIKSWDGTVHYCRASKYRLRDINGETIGLYGASHDITEIKTMQAQLSLLNDSIPGGLVTYEFTADGAINIKYCNDGFCALFGGTKAGLAGRSSFDPMAWVVAADLPILRSQIEELLRSGTPSDCSFRIHTMGGTQRWISLKAAVSERHDGSVFANAILLDITNVQNALEQLRISEEENRLAVQHGGNVVCRYNVAEKTLTISPVLAMQADIPVTLTGVPEEPIRLGMISPETADTYRAFFSAIQNGNRVGSMLYQQRYSNVWRWTEAKSSTVFSADGEPVKAVISLFDVTDRVEKETIYKKWQQSLNDRSPESYTLFRCNLNNESAPVLSEGKLHTFDLIGMGQTFNERASAYANKMLHSDDRDSYIAFVNSDYLLANYYRGKRNETMDFRELTPDGSYRWLRLSIDLVEMPSSTDVEAYLMYENVNAEKWAELENIRRSESDPLTGILNRTAFKDKVEKLLRNAQPNRRFAMIMLDIDGFKQVNDAFGHSAGDAALIKIATSLHSIVRNEDLVARLGGDEFMVFLNGIHDEKAVKEKAMQICALSRRAFSLEVQISGSVGIVFAPYDGMDFDTLYKKVDAALYHVKGSGKDNIAVYSDDMAEEHLRPELDVLHSINGKPKEKKRRMLIVDDNNISNIMLQNIFTEDFIVEKAKDGNTALIRLRHYGNAISVVLLDLIMPGMDGFAVLRVMQESEALRSIPVIIVSGDESRETCLRAVRAGATDFVTKPVDPDVLRIRVRSAISKAENERLRAKNNLLELQSKQQEQSKLYLNSPSITFIDYNWVTGTFDYYSTVPNYLLGKYDGRSFWKILLCDLVADTATVQTMQRLVYQIAEDRENDEASIDVMLKTPQNTPHHFRMNVRKLVNTYHLTNRIVISLIDLDYRKCNRFD